MAFPILWLRRLWECSVTCISPGSSLRSSSLLLWFTWTRVCLWLCEHEQLQAAIPGTVSGTAAPAQGFSARGTRIITSLKQSFGRVFLAAWFHLFIGRLQVWEILHSGFYPPLGDCVETGSSWEDGKIRHTCLDSFHGLPLLHWLTSQCVF